MNIKKKNKSNEKANEFLWDKNSPEFDKIMKNYFLDTRVLHINERRTKSKKKNRSLIPSDYFDINYKNKINNFLYEQSKNRLNLNDDISDDENDIIYSSIYKKNSNQKPVLYNYSFKNYLKEYEKELSNSKKIIKNNSQNIFVKKIKNCHRNRNKSVITSLPKINSYQINDNLDNINQNISQMSKYNNSIKITPKNIRFKLDFPKSNKKMIKINLIRINNDFSKIFLNTLKLGEENSKKIQYYFDKKKQLKEKFNYFENKFF